VIRVGLISDTHGLLRPQALAALQGSDHIVHAGDIGKREILEALAKLAPVTAVRGNNDEDAWAAACPDSEILQIGAVSIYVLHDRKALNIDPRAAGHDVVVAGHSHKPAIEERDGVLYINPGSAGPRRFKLPVTVGELIVYDGKVSARIIELQI
jgi:uncharacterized protein